MLTDKTKVTSDYNYLGVQKKSPCGLYSTFAVCFLYILVLGLFVFNFLTINRIKVLENDVEILKQTLSSFKVFDDNLIKDIIGFEDEEDIEAYDSDQNPKVVVTSDWNITEYDYENYDQSNENDTNLFDDDFYAKLMSKLNNEGGKGQYQSAANLTKDKLEFKRTKRNIIAATDDGVIINSEPYAQKRARNLSSRYTLKGGSVTQYPARPSSIGSPWPVHPYPYSSTPSYTRTNTVTRRTTKAPTVLSRRSRVKHHEQARPEPLTKSVKPYQLKSMGGSYFDSYEDTTTTSPDFTVVRDLGMNRRKRILKPLASAHYNGDTSNYIYGQHENFLGNGHLRHPQSRFVDWKASDWVRSLGMDNHFTLDNGYLTIKDSGLYLVYAQIYYLDEHDTTGYRVLKNDRTILQCTLTVHSVERRLKGNTCYTGGVEHFSANDKLSIEDITEGMLSKFEVGKSFFGIVKLGDAK